MPPVPPTPAERLGSLRAVLFDLDGVLTPTIDVHIAAWSRLFSRYLAEHHVTPSYSVADYYAYIDGRPRVDGVRAMLASRGIELPDGTPDDPADSPTVWGLGNSKNGEFRSVLENEGVRPYAGSVSFLDAVIAAGLQVAVVTSSLNGQRVLDVAGLRDRFEFVVDGITAADHRLPGKPAPDTYVFGAHLLGLEPADCAIVEDAISGVAAGRNGGFGLVIGLDRGVSETALLAAGADVVVSDLNELTPFLDSGRASSVPAGSVPAGAVSSQREDQPS